MTQLEAERKERRNEKRIMMTVMSHNKNTLFFFSTLSLIPQPPLSFSSLGWTVIRFLL